MDLCKTSEFFSEESNIGCVTEAQTCGFVQLNVPRCSPQVVLFDMLNI